MSEEEICRDVLKKLKETEQIYIVEHDVPISVSKHLFRFLNDRRKLEARRRGEEQYEWEDLLFDLAFKGKTQHSDPIISLLTRRG